MIAAIISKYKCGNYDPYSSNDCFGACNCYSPDHYVWARNKYDAMEKLGCYYCRGAGFGECDGVKAVSWWARLFEWAVYRDHWFNRPFWNRYHRKFIESFSNVKYVSYMGNEKAVAVIELGNNKKGDKNNDD